jgi:hypothetical protein
MDKTFASEMVEIIEEKLRHNAGISSVNVDGQAISFDREQLLEELDYWKRKAAQAKTPRQIFRGINIGKSF